MQALTPKQHKIFEWLCRQINSGNAPPTLAEIQAAHHLSSPNAARQYLQSLAEKGYIELRAGVSRGIRLCADYRAQTEHPDSLPPAAPALAVIGRVAAGLPIFSPDNIIRYYSVDPSVFTPPADYLLRVEGMSMSDAGILDGDLLAVRHSEHAENGQVVVARIDDEVTVKRFFRENEETVLLKPENPAYEAIRVSSARNFRIEGLGVGVLRNPGAL